ncbi:MAG: trypsin-like peptidase domain-containing protein [Spirochaetota bacterium]|nr:trypsin-like peptidase domain-containing protein [Spirochaetota bacterium]
MIKDILICFVIISLFTTKLYANQFIEFNRYFINAAKKAKHSVVNIVIYKSFVKRGKKYLTKVGYGSGTILSTDGYIVTNYHVLKKGDFFQVALYDGSGCDVIDFHNGKYYIADDKTDIALLKIDKGENELLPIVFDNSNDLLEGEWVIAIGNPYGLSQSITSGIVSSKGRSDIGFADIEDFIQTDVPINPGNSGGALVNLSGKLVGINTAIRTVSGGYQGISFAIPSNIVKRVCSDLKKYGRVRRGWLGFLVRERRSYRKGESSFLEVISVIKDSPADFAGIRKGDIIYRINGERLLTLNELIKSVRNKTVGSELDLKISREGKLYEHSLIFREKRIHQNIQRRLQRLYSIYGIELDENKKTRNVVVSYLSPMGAGYQSGLKRGDIIMSLNGRDISNLEIFVKILKKSKHRIYNMEIIRDSKLYSLDFENSQ